MRSVRCIEPRLSIYPLDTKTTHNQVACFQASDSGRATRALVAARTQELAAAAGRIPPHVTQDDYEQAKRELTGETDRDRQIAILDSIPQ